MRSTSVVRAVALALGLTLTVGDGIVAANPADGFRNQQDYAWVDLATDLDGCVTANPSVIFVAGELLKEPLSGGAPRPWSDVSVFLRLHDQCAGTSTELTGFAFAPPDITRLESASVADIVVVVTDPSGEQEAEVTVTFDWTAAGPATSSLNNDRVGRHFRQDRSAPAEAVGGLQVTDGDGDVWTSGFGLTDEDAYAAEIGFANEIIRAARKLTANRAGAVTLRHGGHVDHRQAGPRDGSRYGGRTDGRPGRR